MAVLDTWRLRGDERVLRGRPLDPDGLELAHASPASRSASSSSASSPPSSSWPCWPWPCSTSPSPPTSPTRSPSVEARITRVFDGDRRRDGRLPPLRVRPADEARGRPRGARSRPWWRPRTGASTSTEGVDARGLIRALRADASSGEYEQGASTITQQLVRLAYTDDRSPTLRRKLREAVLARELESRLTKEEILFKYLSRIYLGSGNYGVAAAAESYFRKPVRDLDLSEAALLAGLIPAPSVLDPRINPSGAESQRRAGAARSWPARA